MAPSPLPEPLTAEEGARLLEVAHDSIVRGLGGAGLTLPDLGTLPAGLGRPAGVFVTLEVDGQLNGCIGTITPDQALAHATARHARSAAFEDPRLPLLRPEDYPRLTVEVSVLSALTPVAAGSPEQLLASLRPHVDGLVLTGAGRRGVFLPKVWERLPEPGEFVAHLLFKAGLPPAWWPPDAAAQRFTVQEFSSSGS
jgi:AmmeMemoRadiSam system protein A